MVPVPEPLIQWRRSMITIVIAIMMTIMLKTTQTVAAKSKAILIDVDGTKQPFILHYRRTWTKAQMKARVYLEAYSFCQRNNIGFDELCATKITECVGFVMNPKCDTVLDLNELRLTSIVQQEPRQQESQQQEPPTLKSICPNPRYQLSIKRRYSWNARPTNESAHARQQAGWDVAKIMNGANVLEIGGPTQICDIYKVVKSVDFVVQRTDTTGYFRQPAHTKIVGGGDGGGDVDGGGGGGDNGNGDGTATATPVNTKVLDPPLNVWDAVHGQTLLRHAALLHGVKDASYDVVFASHVLEHVVDPLSALKEWDRVLKPGGAFVLILPWAGGGPIKKASMNWTLNPGGFIWWDQHKEPATFQELLHLHAINASFRQDVLQRRGEQILRMASYHDEAHDATQNQHTQPDAPFPYISRQELYSLNNGTDIDENLVHWHVWDFDLLHEVVGGCFGYDVQVMSLWNDFHQILVATKPYGSELGETTPEILTKWGGNRPLVHINTPEKWSINALREIEPLLASSGVVLYLSDRGKGKDASTSIWVSQHPLMFHLAYRSGENSARLVRSVVDTCKTTGRTVSYCNLLEQQLVSRREQPTLAQRRRPGELYIVDEHGRPLASSSALNAPVAVSWIATPGRRLLLEFTSFCDPDLFVVHVTLDHGVHHVSQTGSKCCWFCCPVFLSNHIF